jgi:hypothetical protein
MLKRFLVYSCSSWKKEYIKQNLQYSNYNTNNRTCPQYKYRVIHKLWNNTVGYDFLSICVQGYPYKHYLINLMSKFDFMKWTAFNLQWPVLRADFSKSYPVTQLSMVCVEVLEICPKCVYITLSISVAEAYNRLHEMWCHGSHECVKNNLLQHNHWEKEPMLTGTFLTTQT